MISFALHSYHATPCISVWVTFTGCMLWPGIRRVGKVRITMHPWHVFSRQFFQNHCKNVPKTFSDITNIFWQQMSAPLGLDGLFPETPNTSSRRFNNRDIVETLEWRLETLMEKEGKRVTVTCNLSSDPLRGSQCLVYAFGMLFLPLQQNSLLCISFDAHSHHSSVSRWLRLTFVSWKDLLVRYRGRLTKITNDHNASTARIRQAVFPEPLESGIPNVSKKCQQLDLGLYELAPNVSVGLVTYIYTTTTTRLHNVLMNVMYVV